MIEKFFVNRSGNELEKLPSQERQNIIKNIPFRLENFYEEILFFINTLGKDKNIDLNILYRNLKTLVIYKDDSLFKILKLRDFLLKGQTLAYYQVSSNKIVLSEKYHSNEFFHELLHMASSIYSPCENTNFCGISQRSLKRRISIGTSLNEGYTELLCERYFPNYISTSYCEEKNIAWAVEEIIGIEAMYKYYFNADLPGLINNLLKYTDESSILLFLTSSVKNNENRGIKKFLKQVYIKKLQNDLSNGDINTEVFVNKVAFFFYKLGYRKVDNECKKLLNDELKEQIVKQYNKIRINQQNQSMKLVFDMYHK